MMGMFGFPFCCPNLVAQLTLFQSAAADDPAQQQEDEQRRQIDFTIYRIRQAYKTASGLLDDRELLDLAGELISTGTALTETLIRFGDVAEQMVQEAERFYGPKPGLGAIKSQKVKAAAIRLLLDMDLQIPGIPEFALPWVYDWVSTVSINVIVELLNHHELWDLDSEPSQSRAKAKLSGIFGALLKWLSERFAEFSRWLILDWNEVDAATDAVIRSISVDLKQELNASVTELRSLVQNLAAHGPQVRALIEIVAIAVQQAEAFLQMSGPEKKRYAEEVISECLKDMGFPIPDVVIDIAIEIVVSIFNRHGFLRLHTASA